MELQKKIDREISLSELFWNIIFGWRQLICCGVILALLFGGLKYIKDKKDYVAILNSNGNQVKVELTDEEEEQVENARELMERIDDYEKYLSSSVYMQIDSQEEPVMELQYYVKSDYVINYTKDRQRDYTDEVMALYNNYIMSGEMSRQTIKDANLSVSLEDFSELRSCTQWGTSFKIAIAYPDKKKLSAISESLKTQLDKKESEFQVIGSHELKLVTESENMIVDTGLMDKKNTILNNITTIKTQLNALKINMTEQQLSMLNKDQKVADESTAFSAIEPDVNLKYCLLGLCSGFFLVCIWILCKMLFTAKLQSAEEIRTLYKIRLLGEVTLPLKKRYFFPVIDKKLLLIKNRRKKKLSMEQQIKIVSANIILSCKKQKIDNIYITGSEYESVNVEVLSMLKNELSAQEIQVKEGGNIFYDAKSLKTGTDIGNIIFVEQTGRSIYDEIFNELNQAREQNNNILGIVVLA